MAPKRIERIQFEAVSSHLMRWDGAGQCFETIDDAREARRPDCDFGTPTGDLIIDPWIQAAISAKEDGQS